jgi:type I restriction enzyme S subunit
VGAAVIVREEHPNLVLSDKSLRLVLDTSKVLPEFLLFALRLPEARSFIENNATGSSSSMRNISQDKIKLVPVPITDFDLQARLVETVQRLEVQRSKLVDSSRKQFEAISALPAAYLRLAFARQF